MLWKSVIGHAAAIDLGVRFANRPQQGLGRRELAILVIEVRHAVGRQLAGQLARRVGPHAVGHHQQVAALLQAVPANRRASSACES